MGKKEASAETTQPVLELEPPRKPYKAPRLRFLGSVRELTWGDAGAYADGVSSQERP